MAKINKHIEIVRSEIPRFSSMGLKSCNMIVDILKRHYARVEVTNVNNAADMQLIVAKNPDLVFLGIKNMPSDVLGAQGTGKIWISEFLDDYGLNYTGSRRKAIELDHNKDLAKTVVSDAGLSTAASFTAVPDQYQIASDLPLGFPLFIKPPKGGGGAGIGNDSIVRDFPAYRQKVQSISDNYHSLSLVEKYLTGREFSVAIIGDSHSKQLLAMPVEIIAQKNEAGDRILSQKIKSDDVERVIGISDPGLRKLLMEFGKDVFEALGARDYGRIDIRMDEHGTAHFLEANLIPGLAKHDFISYFTSACQINESISHESMILKIVQLGLARTETKSQDKIRLQLLTRPVQALLATS